VLYQPVALPLLFLLFLFLLAAVVAMVELRVLAYAYQKLGLGHRYVFALMLASLLGSHINIPLYAIPVDQLTLPQLVWKFGRAFLVPESIHASTTVVAINVGGALIPVLLSGYLVIRTRMYRPMLLGTAAVAAVVNRLAEVVPGVGIAVPMLLPPLAAAGVALILAGRRAPVVAYVAGSMGALIGADLLNLPHIVALRAPLVSIGGAGTFDGVFLTGIIAGLIA
jgi:uncharacterized membrane protein